MEGIGQRPPIDRKCQAGAALRIVRQFPPDGKATTGRGAVAQPVVAIASKAWVVMLTVGGA
jgi:hypothetical protein